MASVKPQLKPRSAKKKLATDKPGTGRGAVLARIARVEGQLRGIRRMVEQNDECLDIIAQVSAIREAVAMLGVELLKDDFVCKWEGKKKIDEAYLKSLFKMQ
ncbi:MAG: metal-sensitive transcriptional regulator [Candidatus Moraniibacteriota bacterium]